jgi:hypothetical protein
MKMASNQEIIDYLIADITELIPEREALDINDPYGDFLEGIIGRSQAILSMMGVPEDKIPSNGDC